MTKYFHHLIGKHVTIVFQEVIIPKHEMIFRRALPETLERKLSKSGGRMHDFRPTVGVFWAVSAKGGVFGAKLGEPAVVVDEAVDKVMDGEMKRALSTMAI